MESHLKRIKMKKKKILVSPRRGLQSDFFFTLKLICNVVLDLHVQQRDSVIFVCVCIYMKICIHFHFLFHYDLS